MLHPSVIWRLRLLSGAAVLLLSLRAVRADVPASAQPPEAARHVESNARPVAHPEPVTIAATPSAAEGGFVDVRKALTFLSSPELDGRGAGTAGSDIASGYIAAKFQDMGLQPLPGGTGFFQPFKLTVATSIDPSTTLSAGDGADWAKTVGAPLEQGKTYQPVALSSQGDVDAPIVFAGYGVENAEKNYDDYAGIDVKGKVVLVMRFEPFDAEGNSAFTGQKGHYSDAAAINAKAALAAKHGAAALVFVNPPNQKDELMVFVARGQSVRSEIPVVQIVQPVAEAILASAKAPNLKALQEAIDQKLKPGSMALSGVKLAGKVAFKREEKDVRNVMGLLPGKGPMANEYVVVGAHYDHLGHGGFGSLAPFSNQIHPGADDNASGTSAMLEIADRLTAAGPQARSIVFVAFTAEEMGLIGSEHFVSHPPIPLEKVSAMVNFDMVGRVKDHKLQIGGSGTAKGFDKIIADASAGTGFELNLKSKGGRGPSDHMSFAAKRIPVLFFFSGTHIDYHRPTDTADKVNFDGVEQVVEMGLKTVQAVAAEPREQYVADFDASGLSIMGSGGVGGGARASLGVMPAYEETTDPGVVITGTVPGSAAEKAGLKDGDRLLKWDDTTIQGAQGLMDQLVKSKPGQVVKLTVVRGGKQMQLDATLTERKG